MSRVQLDPECWLDVWALPAELVPGEAEMRALWDMHPAEKGKVRLAHSGQLVDTPRWSQCYGRAYRYSGVTHEALPVPDALRRLVAWADAHLSGDGECRAHGFDQVLVNWYEDGRHYIGPHSDAERQLRRRSPVVTISLGQERVLRLTSRADGRRAAPDVAMPHGTVVVMGGATQERFLHQVPKVSGAKGAAMGRRVSVTLRKFA